MMKLRSPLLRIGGTGVVVLALVATGMVLIARAPHTRAAVVATASRVYGQPNFTSNTANLGGVSATSLFNPEGVALDSAGGLYVADTFNNRVLFFPVASNGNPNPVVAVPLINGSLSALASNTGLPPITLTGVPQSVPFSMPIQVTDASGTGSGWHLTLTSTQFNAGGNTLPTTALVVQAPPAPALRLPTAPQIR